MPDALPPQGHAVNVSVNGIAADRLRSIVERIERLHEERKALAQDVSDLFKEAKSAGFDVPALRALIRVRARDPGEVEEMEALVEIYKLALERG